MLGIFDDKLNTDQRRWSRSEVAVPPLDDRDPASGERRQQPDALERRLGGFGGKSAKR